MMGKLLAIARTPKSLAPMEEIETAAVSVVDGVEGDARGRKRDRQVTVLFREGWEAACEVLGEVLPWTMRRANLYVEGVTPPQSACGTITIGNVMLEVMGETAPCSLMERSRAGLRAALKPDWRGGVSCRVARGGEIHRGDAVSVRT